MAQINPPTWSTNQLEKSRIASIQLFRTQRLSEDVKEYARQYDEIRDTFERLLAESDAMLKPKEKAGDLLSSAAFLEALRYMPGPPISEDDLEILADVPSLAPSRLRADPALSRRVIDTLMKGLDSRRFPWIPAKRNPRPAELKAALDSSAALVASARILSARRNEAKAEQERAVKEALRKAKFKEVPPRTVGTLTDAPEKGEFCGESRFGTRKADILVRLWDGRVMPIECKVSNSYVNSIKRLNNDAAVKAKSWLAQFGTLQVVPTAVVSGVFKRENLASAQADGLTIFWAHDLKALTRWIAKTKPK